MKKCGNEIVKKCKVTKTHKTMMKLKFETTETVDTTR